MLLSLLFKLLSSEQSDSQDTLVYFGTLSTYFGSFPFWGTVKMDKSLNKITW